MKKSTTFVVAIATLFTVAMVSCKKDHTCKCTATVLGISADSTYTIEKSTKKDAKSQCESNGNALNTQAQIFGGSVSCSLN